MDSGERPHLHSPHASPVDPASVLNMTMKEINQVISELKKENFNLKLRVFFCEDSLQRQSGGPAGEADVRRTNIDLQVEVEMLREHVKKLQKALSESQEQTRRQTPESNVRISKLEKDVLGGYKKEPEEKYALVELRMMDLETGNLNLEAQLQEKSQVILALEKELENEKLKCGARLNEVQAELAECLSEKDFLLSEKEVVAEAHEDTIKSLTCRLKQHKCVCIEKTGGVQQEQLKDIDELLDTKCAKSPPATQERNSDFGVPGTSVHQIRIQIQPSSSAFQETIDRKEDGEGQVTSSSLRSEAEIVGNQVEEQNMRPQERRQSEVKKVKALETRVKEMQQQVEESNNKLEVLEEMLQDLNATVSYQPTQRLDQIFSDSKATERQASGSFDEGYGSGTDQNLSSVRLDTVKDQETNYRRLKIRLMASDRLRKVLAEKASEVETLQNEREHLLCDESKLADGQRHARHDLIYLDNALDSARREIESLMMQMKLMEELDRREMVQKFVVPRDSKLRVFPVNTSRTDCGSRTQKESLSSQLSGGMKKKMKQQPVQQKRKMKMQDTRTEPLDSVSRRPRAININNLEHEEDSSSLRNPSELNTETLRLRSNSLQRSNLNTNQYHHPSHGSSRWSTNPSRSPSLTQEDIGLQRIVAEVKGLTYGISRVLREAHDGGSPGNSRSSDPYSENVKLNKIIKTLKIEKSSNKTIVFEAVKRLQRVNQRKLERLCD
ncbi:CDK5 regulatory subunit-associated protein 2-like isoform X1 [Gadus chalcogrammus]|uniref:CDK5 regulatory subunit-associated protein 2-like isoform X1 n=2 Tax=Gadus chalcogrammus TaxID=1042646 RepID=UPI0024C2E772|nr:CDK5 regulatory subunit-associated protein 2-like isoform X1 [Gadus chalcogrammus]